MAGSPTSVPAAVMAIQAATPARSASATRSAAPPSGRLWRETNGAASAASASGATSSRAVVTAASRKSPSLETSSPLASRRASMIELAVVAGASGSPAPTRLSAAHSSGTAPTSAAAASLLPTGCALIVTTAYTSTTGQASGRPRAAAHPSVRAARECPARWRSIAASTSAATRGSAAPSMNHSSQGAEASGTSRRPAAAITPAVRPARRWPMR